MNTSFRPKQANGRGGRRPCIQDDHSLWREHRNTNHRLERRSLLEDRSVRYRTLYSTYNYRQVMLCSSRVNRLSLILDSGEISGFSVRTMFEKISLHKVAGVFVNFNISRLLVSLFNFTTKVCQKIFSASELGPICLIILILSWRKLYRTTRIRKKLVMILLPNLYHQKVSNILKLTVSCCSVLSTSKYKYFGTNLLI